MSDVKKKREVFFSFEGQEGQKIEIFRMKGGDFLKADIMALVNPEINEEYGKLIFLIQNTVLIDGLKLTFNQIDELDSIDYQMIMESINRQLLP